MTEEKLFLAALDLPDRANRTAYLQEACGDNSELRFMSRNCWPPTSALANFWTDRQPS